MVSSLLKTHAGPVVPIVGKGPSASKPALDPACVDAVFSTGNVLDWGGTVSFPLPDCQGDGLPPASESVSTIHDSDGPTTLHLNTHVAETEEHPQARGRNPQGESQTTPDCFPTISLGGTEQRVRSAS
jgi:hypothetical protein